MISDNLVMCTDSIATVLGLFDFSIAPSLLFYSYIPIGLISLFIGFFVLTKDNYSSTSKSLCVLAVFFFLYITDEILLWISMPAALVYFNWALLILLRSLIVISTLYFVLNFIKVKIDYRINFTIALLLLPVLLLLPTNLNITTFDIDACEASNGPLWLYLYFLEISTILFFTFWCSSSYYRYIKSKVQVHLQNSLVLMSSAFLVAIFSASTIIGNLTLEYEVNLVGPIGMLFLLTTLTYIIVRFKAFNIKLAAAQALVVGIVALVGSQIFFVESTTNTVLVVLTFIFTCIGGYFLVKSVRREIAQREQLEVLTEQLASANDRLKELDKLKSEFVSIASHQLRSPLTSMRGYASMLLDGSYGSIPAKAREAVQRIADSSMFMAKLVENYLNVSRIESGNMKYELSDFNLKLEVGKLVDDKRQEAIKKGLLLTFKSSLAGQGIVHADIGKTLEIVHNLLNNSLKYTKTGSIDVYVHDDVKTKKIYVDITDTGIGMTREDATKLFAKFQRAANANSVNTTGTGLGLYVARTMALAMQGEITATSAGQDQGSTFRFELAAAL